MASTVLAMKSRRLGPLRALAASMRRGIVSGEGRISVAPEAPGAKPTGYRTVFSVQTPYTTLDGFDTHANQLATHAALLNELSDSVAAFRRDLDAAGQGDR